MATPAATATAIVPIGVEGADDAGQLTATHLRGDEALVEGRRNCTRRRIAAIHAELNKVKPLTQAQIPAAALAADQQAVQKSRGIAHKTAGKVATDEHSFDLFVAEQSLQFAASEYPSIETMVEFASWLTRRRERACLAQRADSGPRLEGLVQTTIRKQGPRRRVGSRGIMLAKNAV